MVAYACIYTSNICTPCVNLFVRLIYSCLFNLIRKLSSPSICMPMDFGSMHLCDAVDICLVGASITRTSLYLLNRVCISGCYCVYYPYMVNIIIEINAME